MHLDEAIKQEWEDLVRRSLGKYLSGHKSHEVLKLWNTHHAKFAKVRLKRNIDSEKGHLFVAKHFVPLQGYHEHDYSAFHQPDSLCQRELRNLSNIRRIVKRKHGKGLANRLIPKVFGSSLSDSTIILPYLHGPNYKSKILNASSEDQYGVFIDCIKLSARFNGICNNLQDGFNNVQGFNYDRDAEFLLRVSRAMEKENIARWIYNNNENCRNMVRIYNQNQGISPGESNQYNLESVIFFIREDLGVDLDSRISEITDLESELYEEMKLQHRDCNGLNMVRSKVLDLEDFGYAPETTDISSNCIVVGLGNNAIIRDEQFIYALQAYLAIEDAFERGDLTMANGLYAHGTNGAFKEYVGNFIEEERYSNFLASFFHRSMPKNIHLSGTMSRYTEKEQDSYQSRPSSNTAETLSELYNFVWRLIPYDLKKCSNAEGVRDLFYATGHFYNDLGIGRIDGYVLDGIKNGTNPASSIINGRPSFGRKKGIDANVIKKDSE